MSARTGRMSRGNRCPRRVEPPSEVPASREAAQGVAHVGFATIGEVGLVAVVLRYSHALWAQWVDFNASTAVFSWALIHTAYHFGGSPRRWIFEEPDCRVLQWDGHRQYFADLLEATARHLSSQLGIWSGRYRGPASSALTYLSGAAHCPRRSELFQGNVALRELLRGTMCLPHPHQPGRSIAAVFQEERDHLSPLPTSWHELAVWFGGE